MDLKGAVLRILTKFPFQKPLIPSVVAIPEWVQEDSFALHGQCTLASSAKVVRCKFCSNQNPITQWAYHLSSNHKHLKKSTTFSLTNESLWHQNYYLETMAAKAPAHKWLVVLRAHDPFSFSRGDLYTCWPLYPSPPSSSS